MMVTFDADENGGVGGADGVGGDADVLVVVGQGHLVDGQSECPAGRPVQLPDDGRRRQVRLDAGERVVTPPRHVRTRPAPADAVQLQRVAFHQVPRLVHPDHHRNH